MQAVIAEFALEAVTTDGLMKDLDVRSVWTASNAYCWCGASNPSRQRRQQGQHHKLRARALIIPLEDRFPPWDAAPRLSDGIIVLGGAIDASHRSNEVMLNDAVERLSVVPELARRHPNARILFSGAYTGLDSGSGFVAPSPPRRSYAGG